MRPESAFYAWLVSQADRDDPVGDLANDVRLDRGFPVDTDDYGAMRSSLQLQHASIHALEAFDRAVEEFKRIREQKP